MKEKYPIDFVVLWVDSSDKNWLSKKKQYKPEIDIENEACRYRDWGIFKYWFRAVEQYAPWVNHIYLVTDNQKPEWINLDNPKLTIVDHKEIIDNKYLPTFNSQAIEMNLHKIPGLSEHFVYFNDDMYLGKPVKPTDFFKNGKPVEAAILNSATGMGKDELYAKTMFNDTLLINRHFDRKQVLKGNLKKWVNLKYGKQNIRTLSQLIYPYFTGYKTLHMPTPMLKKTYKEIWAKEGVILEETTSHKFRHPNDVNQYIFPWWELCKNNFVPKNARNIKYIKISPKTINDCVKAIQSNRYKELCINDLWEKEDYTVAKEKIISAFEKKLNKKSSFEK